MNLHRFAWKRMEAIAQANPDLNGTPSYLCEFLFDIYTKAQAEAVRRQADIDDQAASLGRLIYEIGQTPTLLTRDWWLSLWSNNEGDPYWRQVAEKTWADQFGGAVGDCLDSAIPQADLTGAPPEAPTTTGEKLPTLDDVHDAIDLIGDLFKRYGNLPTAAAWVDLTPALQHDWEAVLRVPWIKKKQRRGVPG